MPSPVPAIGQRPRDRLRAPQKPFLVDVRRVGVLEHQPRASSRLDSFANTDERRNDVLASRGSRDSTVPMMVDVVTETVIRCPIGEVAAYASNPDHVREWYVNIKEVEWKTPPPVVVGSQVAFVATFLGRRLSYTYEIVELVPGERLVMRTSEGPFPMENDLHVGDDAGGLHPHDSSESRYADWVLSMGGPVDGPGDAPRQREGPRLSEGLTRRRPAGHQLRSRRRSTPESNQPGRRRPRQSAEGLGEPRLARDGHRE